MTAKTPAQRKQAERKRLRAAGLIPVQVWVKPEHAGQIRELAKKLNQENANEMANR